LHARLTFKASVIEALGPDDAFRVEMPGSIVQMTKRQFSETFPNVMVAESYRHRGVYSYPKFPKKAHPFIVTSEHDHETWARDGQPVPR
jgi:hypothetical protein